MRERKKQKNRESAQRARDRFKAKMRWLEDQVRVIQERHDNLLRENTYMRHLIGDQTNRLNQLLARETAELEKERQKRNRAHSDGSGSPTTSSSCDDADSGHDGHRSHVTDRSQSKSIFSINFLSKSSSKAAPSSIPPPPKPENTPPSIPKPNPYFNLNLLADPLANVRSQMSPILTKSTENKVNSLSSASVSSSLGSMIYPTALPGYLPRQAPRPLITPSLSSMPSMRLSPGGTMHMEPQILPGGSQSHAGLGDSTTNSTSQCRVPPVTIHVLDHHDDDDVPLGLEDDDEDDVEVDVDVGSPIRSDSDLGLGSSDGPMTSELNSSSDMDNSSEH